MANAREILDRMKSIQDTMKITNAMYMISSSKLKKGRRDRRTNSMSTCSRIQWMRADFLQRE